MGAFSGKSHRNHARNRILLIRVWRLADHSPGEFVVNSRYTIDKSSDIQLGSLVEVWVVGSYIHRMMAPREYSGRNIAILSTYMTERGEYLAPFRGHPYENIGEVALVFGEPVRPGVYDLTYKFTSTTRAEVLEYEVE